MVRAPEVVKAETKEVPENVLSLFNRSAHSAGPGKQNDNNGPTERNAIFEGFMPRKLVRAMNGKQRSLEEKSQTLDFGPAPGGL